MASLLAVDLSDVEARSEVHPVCTAQHTIVRDDDDTIDTWAADWERYGPAEIWLAIPPGLGARKDWAHFWPTVGAVFPDSFPKAIFSNMFWALLVMLLGEFRKGKSWLTPGAYLEPDLVGLLPWLTGCSILIVVCLLYLKISLKAMRHVNRKLAPELEIHLFACSFGILFFPILLIQLVHQQIYPYGPL